MQSLLFVFIGLPGKDSNADLQVLLKRLDEKFRNNEIAVRFARKEELLSARLNDVSFYISFLKNKDELKDWCKMAEDFELELAKKPIDKSRLVKRYARLKNSSFNPYTKIHYVTGLTIMEEMEKFDDLSIYSFQ